MSNTVTTHQGTYQMLPDRGQTFALYAARDWPNWGIVHSDRCGQNKVASVSVIPLTRAVVEAMLEAEVNEGGGTYTCKACVARKVSARDD
jgi:hypothetical protein